MTSASARPVAQVACSHSRIWPMLMIGNDMPASYKAVSQEKTKYRIGVWPIRHYLANESDQISQPLR
jgi:hypothetical protein